jgi:hypothetical protein
MIIDTPLRYIDANNWFQRFFKYPNNRYIQQEGIIRLTPNHRGGTGVGAKKGQGANRDDDFSL